MRMGIFAVLLVLAGSMFYAIVTNPCSDGTAYGQCSKVTAGKFCTGLIANPALQDNAVKCKCTDVQGYRVDPENPDKCIAAAAGCANNNPACKADEQCTNNECKKKTGCLYNNPACLPTQECKDNACVLRSGCEFSNPPCAVGQVCQGNQCVSVSGGEIAAPPSPPAAPSGTEAAVQQPSGEGPDLINYEPKAGSLCCTSALAILALGMFVAYKRS